MKKFLFILMLVALTTSCSSIYTVNKPKWYQNNSKIEVINETTVIFKNVDKIEIKSNTNSLITYIYDLNHSKLMKVARGSFKVELSNGNYLIQANKPITKTIYEVIIE